MSGQPVSTAKKSLRRGQKIAIGAGALIVASSCIGCSASGNSGNSGKGDNSAAHGATAASSTPSAGHGSPAAKPKAGAAGSPTAHAAPPGPAQKLAGLDGNYRPAEQYQQVLDALAPRCKEDRPHLAVLVDTTLAHLKKNGVSEEDGFSVLQKLEHSVPPGKPRTDCASAAAAYAARRQQN